MRIWKTGLLYCAGGCGYMALELLWRGRTHGSMFLAGGLCFLLIGQLNRTEPRLPYPLRLLTGAAIITAVELAAGLLMAWAGFFHGDILSGFFAEDAQVVLAAWEYLKAYAIDCLLTSFLFCFIGYFNGCGKTFFVMLQGIIGAFCVRIPVSLLMAGIEPVSVFRVGLATPSSTLIQIVLCVGYYLILRRRAQQKNIETH